MANKDSKISGMTWQSVSVVFLSLIALFDGVYLIKQYYSSNFGEQVISGMLCSASGFFNCDVATYSSFSAIMGIPLGVFGVVVASIFLVNVFFQTIELEKFSKLISKINIFFVCVLFIYSLLFNHSICPYCLIYYISSALIFYIFHKYGISIDWKKDRKIFNKPTSIWASLFLVLSIPFMIATHNGKKDQEIFGQQLVKDFNSLPVIGDPSPKDSYMLTGSEMGIDRYPIRVTVFSDFECPYCKLFSKTLEKLISKYGDKIGVQYMFYPLDKNCNPNIERDFHKTACKMAYLASCGTKDNFKKIHDSLVSIDGEETQKLIGRLIEKYSLKACTESDKTKETIMDHIRIGGVYKVDGTPTVIVNGRKVQVGLPFNQWIALFDKILNESI